MRKTKLRYGATSQFSVRERYNQQSQKENCSRKWRKRNWKIKNDTWTKNSRVYVKQERMKSLGSWRNQKAQSANLKNGKHWKRTSRLNKELSIARSWNVQITWVINRWLNESLTKMTRREKEKERRTKESLHASDHKAPKG